MLKIVFSKWRSYGIQRPDAVGRTHRELHVERRRNSPEAGKFDHPLE
jgi:hypothetical protein